VTKPMILLAGLILLGSRLVTPPVSSLEYQRGVTLAEGAAQQYIVIAPEIWRHARADLGDLRLYAGGVEAPYALQTEGGSAARELVDCRILQPATVAGNTQFLLDMSGTETYDRVELQLKTLNFVSKARMEGANDVHARDWALLGSSTLYDFATENLGHNGMLQMPESTFRFLRVTLDGGVKPSEVLAAQAAITREHEAVWVTVAEQPRIEQKGKDTVLTFPLQPNVPVERVAFDIGNSQENFLRTVEAQTLDGQPGEGKEGTAQTLGTGTLRRIHILRGGKHVDEEVDSMTIFVQPTGGARGDSPETNGSAQNPQRVGTLKILVHNGDDRPLAISNARLQQAERRIYFQAPGAAQATLYYGDANLGAPSYDYARLFQLDAAAGQAKVLAEEINSAYQKPADTRPWSERHPAAMWTALLAAILALGAVAVRSLRSTAA
jgi:hypothetical protein